MINCIIIGIIGVITQTIYIYYEKKDKYKIALTLKTIASFEFFLVGLTALIIEGTNPYNLFICIGLLMGAIGDFLLSYTHIVDKNNKNKIYALGIISFLLGHVFYLVSLSIISNNILLSIIIGLALAIIALYIILRNRKFSKLIFIFGLFYIIILMMIVSFSFVNLVLTYSTKTLIFFIASILFASSDLLIIYNTFGKKKNKLLSITNLAIYYIAQLMIAFTILI